MAIKIERAGEQGIMAPAEEPVIVCETPEDLEWYLDNLDLVTKILDNLDTGVSN